MYRSLVLVINLAYILGFVPTLFAQDDPRANNIQTIGLTDSTLLNTQWKNSLNARDSSLMNYYTPDAVKIISFDSILTGPEAIYQHYTSLAHINYIRTPYTIEANEHRGISYEINIYKPKNDRIYIQLVIYEKVGDKKLRAFEYDAARPILNMENIPKEISEELKERREQWMAYCNAHDVPGLIYDLYSDNTLYYNHRPVVKGRKALVQEYAYMNNEQYSLSLKSRHLTFVNDTTVFEIGQCEGSYNGKYILIWKKEEDGVWRIFIDSNV